MVSSGGPFTVYNGFCSSRQYLLGVSCLPEAVQCLDCADVVSPLSLTERGSDEGEGRQSGNAQRTRSLERVVRGGELTIVAGSVQPPSEGAPMPVRCTSQEEGCLPTQLLTPHPTPLHRLPRPHRGV